MSMSLSFYDQGRQDYSAAVPPEHAGEFMLGAYEDDDSVDTPGEFKIVLHDFDSLEALSPQVCVFGDGLGAFRKFIALGGLKTLEPDCESVDEFSRRLLALGLPDRSDKPLAHVAV